MCRESFASSNIKVCEIHQYLRNAQIISYVPDLYPHSLIVKASLSCYDDTLSYNSEGIT